MTTKLFSDLSSNAISSRRLSLAVHPTFLGQQVPLLLVFTTCHMTVRII